MTEKVNGWVTIGNHYETRFHRVSVYSYQDLCERLLAQWAFDRLWGGHLI